MKKLMKKVLCMALAGSLVALCAGCSTKAPATKESTVGEKTEAAGQETPAESANSSNKNGDEYPNKTITMIVPFNAGGGTDIGGRIFAQFLEKELGGTIVVKNTSGGGGVIGFKEGADAKPDGYTMVLTTSSLLLQKYTAEVYQPYEDMTQLAIYNFDPAGLMVKSDSPWETLDDFVKYSKEHPGELICSNSGTGSIWNVCALQFQEMAGTDWVHVPYDGGNDAAVAVAGGHADFCIVQDTEPLALISAGELQCLAIASEQREEIAELADVPTFAEAGYPDYMTGVWRGFACPKDTPQDIVDKISAAMERVNADPEYQKAMKNANCKTFWNGKDKIDAYLKEVDEGYAKTFQK